MRKRRQNAIVELISNETISTQDELIQKLKVKGFKVTQATVSRDIKDLKLIKKIGDSGKSVYSLNMDEDEKLVTKYHTILSGSVISVDYATNISVLKTHSGMANAACASIDAMNWEGVVGTLAGDDTIFVLCRSEQDARNFCIEIKEKYLE
ncbi:MAG: arginine repressor [Ruminococcaceae bacterium]|nr:arginine repressor [Oscillospiraceae bacterium]